MEEFNLVIRPDEPMDQYTIVKVFRELGLSLANLGSRQNEMIPLLAMELKQFGGNFQINKDRGKALGRVIKYLNLGLEQAAKIREGVSEETFDYEMAKKIVINKSLVDIYKLGKMYFEKDLHACSELLNETEIQIGNSWFRLFSEADCNCIKSLIDIEHSRGMISEHEQAMKLAKKFIRLRSLLPFLPISKYCLPHLKYLAGKKGGPYPTKSGLIEIMLLSLLIACLFRDKDQFFIRKTDKENLEWAIEARGDSLKAGLLNEELLQDASKKTFSIREYVEQVKRDSWAKLGDLDIQQRFLFEEILMVAPEEVEAFLDLLFFEPAKFREKVSGIEDLFYQYFVEAKRFQSSKKKKINIDEAAIYFSLNFVADRIVNEAKEFYFGLEDFDVAKDKIREYWYDKVLLKKPAEGAAISVIKNISPLELSKLPLDQVINATRYFLSWPLPKQKDFVVAFNPNRFFNEEKLPGKLLKFLRLVEPIEPISESGLTASKDVIIHQQEQYDWLVMITNKINWENVSPYFVYELWEKGTKRVRDVVFSHRGEIKMSLRAFEDYYMKEGEDLRLFVYALETLINQDIIQTNYVWKKLLFLSEGMSEIKKILKLKRK